MLKRIFLPALLLLGVVASIFFWRRQQISAETTPPSNLIAALSDPQVEGFALATEPNNIEFPRDLGAHNDYQTEWWYYTGNLATAEGREFGFQFTIFRRALEPASEAQEIVDSEASEWRTEQVYLVHFTVSDIAEEQFYHSERYARGGAGLAGAQAQPYRVFVEDWFVEEVEDGDVVLSAENANYALNLNLTQTLPPILHGEGGLSAKSLEAGNASYYYSFVQQIAEGTVRIGDETFNVTGKAWKDHEYSTSVLTEGALGWDWFSLQFDDGSALMLFQIRREGGEIEPASSGTFVYPSGESVDIDREDWGLTVDNRWESGDTGASYPVAWSLDIPKIGLAVTGEAKMENQELVLTAGSYWEGAVEFTGTREGNAISAEGYIEMTGYAEQDAATAISAE